MVNSIESYEIDGKLYVNTKFLCAFFSKSEKQVGRWKKDGCPIEDKPKELSFRGDVFSLEKILHWYKENINQTKARATSRKNKDSIGEEYIDIDEQEVINDIQGKIKQANEMLQLKGTSQDEADRIKKILDGLTQAVKLGEQAKELIPKKDSENVIVEFAITLISGYKRDIKILPSELANRSEKEIRNILEKTYKANIETYRKRANSSILSKEKIYDIIERIMELLDVMSVDEILKKLEDNK